MKEKNKDLKYKIIVEYIFIAITILYTFLMPFIADFMIGDNTGIDGIGPALGIAIMLQIILFILAGLFFIINPIRIMISYKGLFKNILSKKKRYLYYTLTVLPIFLVISIILIIVTGAYLFNQKYLTSKSSYVVEADNYKTAIEFKKELTERNLIFSKDYEDMLSNLNKKYNAKADKYHYEEASLMALYNSSFSDSKDYNEIISFNSSIKAPVYIYNSILILTGQDKLLQYAPIARYGKHTYISQDKYPYFEDYYIECKILYVDGNIYAIIGVSQSYNIFKYFDNNKEDMNDAVYWFYHNYPFYMILSEKENITTFVEGKYHSEGAIANSSEQFEMRLNKEEYIYPNYPVRKVDKLNLYTVNSVAQELQENILQESIKYHYNK